MTRYTVVYSMVEYRAIDVDAATPEEAKARVMTEEALYSTNPLFTTDTWLDTVFNAVVEVKESSRNGR